MRTTLTLNDNAALFATEYAAARALRLGEAVSELILRARDKDTRGSSAAKAFGKPVKKNGVWVFDVPATTPKVTSEDIKAFLEDGA